MPLSADQRKQLRRIGHHLSPVVTVGEAGLSDGVIEETQRALDDHELVKVKVAVPERDARRETVAELCEECEAELVQAIGKVALIFRRAERPDPRKSNVLRAGG